MTSRSTSSKRCVGSTSGFVRRSASPASGSMGIDAFAAPVRRARFSRTGRVSQARTPNIKSAPPSARGRWPILRGPTTHRRRRCREGMESASASRGGSSASDQIPMGTINMADRCRLVGYLLTATLVSDPICGALAQAPEDAQPSGACYQVIAGRAGSQPAGTILLNRCSGQTWMLIRTHQSAGDGIDSGQVAYRWRPIPTGDTQVAVTSSTSPKVRALGPASQNNAKCFTFQGRRYCE